MTDRCNPDGIRIIRTNDDLADVVCFLETFVFPGFSSILAHEHSRSRIRRTTRIILSCTHPYRFVVLPIHGKIPNAERFLVVKNGSEALTVIHGLPQSA